MKLRTSLAAPLALALLCYVSRSEAQVFTAFLSGPAESPPNASVGTGFTTVTINPATHMLQVQFSFSNLSGTTTAAHIHAATATPGTGTAGVATQTPTFSGFPTGVTSGSYSNTFDMSQSSTWNPAYVTANGGTAAGAENAFVAAIIAGKAYLNIHTSVFPSGEIRGFLLPAAAPELGSSLALLAIGCGALGLARLRRRRA